MVKKRYLLFLLPTLLISSCGKEPRPLRSDIQEFIQGFSLEKSMEIYKKASYFTTFESVVKGVKENETEYVTFDCRSDSSISYTHELKKYKDSALVETVSESIVTEDNKYIHSFNGEEEEYTKDECISLISTYFYRSTPVEGFHDYGMYSGDYINGIAYTFQDYIKIDQEKKTLEFKILVEDSEKSAKINHEMKVDETGMLLRVYNKTENTSTSEYAFREITTSKE